ncbi:MAG: hypothetical protein ACXVBE_10660, partial [Bdellovibrionota bacterium]
MKLLIFYLVINTLLLANAFSQTDPELLFTNKDMWTLSQKMAKSLRKCKPLRGNPNVIVDVQNATDEFVNKTEFSELIHSMFEKKTHTKPETKEPDFEIRAKLEARKPLNSAIPKSKYILTAQVFQAEE